MSGIGNNLKYCSNKYAEGFNEQHIIFSNTCNDRAMEFLIHVAVIRLIYNTLVGALRKRAPIKQLHLEIFHEG